MRRQSEAATALWFDIENKAGSVMLMRGESLLTARTLLQNEARAIWLGHADARQVSDLPGGPAPNLRVSDPARSIAAD